MGPEAPWQHEGWVVAVLAVVSCAVLTVTGGKDAFFDQLHYHLYLGWSVFSDRLQVDFMPASLQSYLNPLGYVPFYLLIRTGLPALAIGLLLATAHASNIVLCWWLAQRLVPGSADVRRTARLCAVVVAATAPTFVLMVGGSWLDVLLGPLILVAAGLLIGTAPGLPSSPAIAAAGFLLGAASGFKPVNLAAALAGGAVLIMTPGRRARLSLLLVYAAACAAGGLASGGWHAWRMWEAFGNPVFPTFNAWFRSPDYREVNDALTRFRPADLGEWLTLPWRLLLPRTYVEALAPEPRAAALFLLWPLTAWSIRRGWIRPVARQAPLTRLLLLCAAYFVTWALLTTNGRYGYTLFLLCGIAAMVLLYQLVRDHPLSQALLIGTAILLCLPTAFSEFRYDARLWRGAWFDVEVPTELRDHPHLLITLDLESGSVLLPWLHPGSALINDSDQNVLSPDGPGGAHLRTLLERYSGRVLLADTVHGPFAFAPDGTFKAPSAAQLNAKAASLGLEVVPHTPCYRLGVRNEPHPLAARTAAGVPYGAIFWWACPARAIRAAPSASAHLQRFDDVFRALARACPEILRPAEVITRAAGPDGSVRRAFGITELDVVIASDGAITLHQRWQRWTRPWSTVAEVRAGHVSCPSLAPNADDPLRVPDPRR